MLKHLVVQYKGVEISLECTHKKDFPPPQMYSSTAEDIDTLWRQGALTQIQYQMLLTWKEKCGLMVMGPRCLDCPLALKRNPRPGRPNVIETEPWLPAKERMHWQRLKAEGKRTPAEPPELESAPMEPVNAAAERAVLGTVERGPVAGPKATVLTPVAVAIPALELDAEDLPDEDPEEEEQQPEKDDAKPKPDPAADETTVDGPSFDLDDDIISALADD
jgi:hypothetical protein